MNPRLWVNYRAYVDDGEVDIFRRRVGRWAVYQCSNVVPMLRGPCINILGLGYHGHVAFDVTVGDASRLDNGFEMLPVREVALYSIRHQTLTFYKAPP